MKQRLQDHGGQQSKRATIGSNPKVASRNHQDGELILFADISLATSAKIELEKSCHELSLQINRAQQADRLRTGERLDKALTRSLALMNPVSALQPKIEPEPTLG